MTPPQIKEVLLFRNGNIATFDGQGQQIPALQESVAHLWAEHAIRCGYDPEGVRFNGYVIHKVKDGWIILEPDAYEYRRAYERDHPEKAA